MTLEQHLVMAYGSQANDDGILSKCVCMFRGGWHCETGAEINQWDISTSLEVTIEWKEWFPGHLSLRFHPLTPQVTRSLCNHGPNVNHLSSF